MSKSTKVQRDRPVAEPDPEVLAFRAQFDERSPLDQIIRDVAQRMLQAAIEAEVDEFLITHDDRLDEHGNRLVVRNGRQPARQILTGAGKLEVQQPRVRDKSKPSKERVTFTSKILPPYLRRSKSIDELIPWLYLKGISTSDFPEALQALLGENAKGLSPNVIVRLKEQWSGEYDDWSRRDLSEKQDVYFWADGIHTKVRLEGPENDKQWLLVLMGATADGKKELIAVVDGYRESEQSWCELLIGLKQRGLALAPKLAAGDGALGFWAALRKVFRKRASSVAGCIRRPTCSARCPRACSREQRPTYMKSGWPRPESRPAKPSIPSWRNTGRNTKLPATACRKTEMSC